MAVSVEPAPTGRPGVARPALQGFAAEALVFPAGLITAAYLTRMLGPTDYGRIALIYAAVAPVAWIAATTLAGRAGVKLLADAADWRAMGAALLRANAALGVVAMLAFAAAAPAVAAGLRQPELTPYLALAAVEIGLMPVTRVHRDALIARGFYGAPAAATFVYQTGRLVLVLALVAAGWSIAGVIATNLIARAAEILVCRARLPVPVRGAVPGALRSQGRLFGALFLYALCLQVFNRVDLLMLGFLDAPPDAIGNYGAAQNLAQAPGLFAMVFAPLTIAALRRAETDGEPGEAEAFRLGSARLALGLWALAAPVAAGSGPLAVLLFGSRFSAAGPLLAWLGIAGGGVLVLAVRAAHEIAAGRYHRPLLAAVPMVLLAVTLQVAWIPRYGALGAARATALAAIAAALIAERLAVGSPRANRGFDLARTVAAGAAGFGITHLAGRIGWPSPLDILAGCAGTVLALLATGMMTPADARRLAAAVRGGESPGVKPA